MKKPKKRKHVDSICSCTMKRKMAEMQITPLQMSFDLKIGRDKIYFWLRGDTIPKLDEAAEIADYFNISLDELCGR